MAFDADITHWPTIADFAAHLQGVPRPSWCKGITNHNTYIPNETQWRGLASMQSMMRTYIEKGWSAGPHLYLAAAAPTTAHRGIWQMTPLGHVGVHAGACNEHHLGIEWVGDFDARQPSAEQYTLGITVNLLILKHWGLPPESVNVHRDCMPGRTCPGKHLTSDQIRASLRAPAPHDPFREWGAIGKPTGAAMKFATPLAWLVNKKLGKCVTPETYSLSGAYSVTEFERGLIIFYKARNTTRVELF